MTLRLPRRVVAGLVAPEPTPYPDLTNPTGDRVAAAVTVAVQNRIDRRDPKLAAAPIRNEPEYTELD